jgi:hypothetical protein
MDLPVRLGSGGRCVGNHIVVGGSYYGRVLFTERPTAIECSGSRDMYIAHNIIEILDGVDGSIGISVNLGL